MDLDIHGMIIDVGECLFLIETMHSFSCMQRKETPREATFLPFSAALLLNKYIHTFPNFDIYSLFVINMPDH